MARRVEHYSKALLGLKLGKSGTCLDCPGNTSVEVGDCDVEVHYDLLFTCHRGQGGRNVIGLHLKRQSRTARPRSDGYPIRLISNSDPAQEAFVERRKCCRIR